MRWGEPVPESRTGVYLVCLSPSPGDVQGLRQCPLSEAALDELLTACPGIRLDGERADANAIADRLASYWLPDECVLYIGLSGQPLRTRVRQYYRTPLGAAKPHKGGWWLKTLSILDQLWVHYAVTPDFEEGEASMLRTFAATVSKDTRRRLPADDPVMPFANLRDGDWRRKNHRLIQATATSPTARAGKAKDKCAGRSADSSPPPAAGRPPGPVEWRLQTQPVTSKDIEAGRIRVPRGATKRALPARSGPVTVLLRGRMLECHWDPRYGPPERSGVVGVGRAAARELLKPGEILDVTFHGDGVVELA